MQHQLARTLGVFNAFEATPAAVTVRQIHFHTIWRDELRDYGGSIGR